MIGWKYAILSYAFFCSLHDVLKGKRWHQVFLPIPLGENLKYIFLWDEEVPIQLTPSSAFDDCGLSAQGKNVLKIKTFVTHRIFCNVRIKKQIICTTDWPRMNFSRAKSWLVLDKIIFAENAISAIQLLSSFYVRALMRFHNLNFATNARRDLHVVNCKTCVQKAHKYTQLKVNPCADLRQTKAPEAKSREML